MAEETTPKIVTRDEKSDPDSDTKEPRPKGGQVRKLKMQVSQTWEGPYPPPAVLRAMDEIVPGAAERIIAQFEAEADHRQKTERRAQWLAFNGQMASRASGLIFAGGCLWLIWCAISAGAYWAAAVLSAAMVVGGINAIMARR